MVVLHAVRALMRLMQRVPQCMRRMAMHWAPPLWPLMLASATAGPAQVSAADVI